MQKTRDDLQVCCFKIFFFHYFNFYPLVTFNCTGLSLFTVSLTVYQIRASAVVGKKGKKTSAKAKAETGESRRMVQVNWRNSLSGQIGELAKEKKEQAN